jgi:thiamine biosynthesis lipoprotein
MKREKEIKKMIKKIINIALAIALTASLAGCGSKSAARDAAGDSATAQSTAAQTAAVQEESSDQSDGIEDGSEGENTPQKAAESEQEASAESVEIPETPYVRDDGGVSIDVFAMDTYMNLLAYGDRAEEAVLAAAQEIHRIDDMLSTGNPESEISKLNAAGTGHVSEDTLYLIKESKTLYEETNGLFDIAIYPVMKLWGFPSQEYRVPTEEEIKTGLTLTDASKIAIGGAAAAAPESAAEGKTEAKTTAKTEEASKAKAEGAEAAEAKNGEAEKEKDKKEDKAAETEKASVPEAGDGGAATDQPADAEEPAAADQPAAAATQETEAADKSAQTLVLFGASGMEIDLGGIAKGFTSSRVMEVFREYGIEHGLVSLGGNVQALGTKENGKPWRVAIQNPESELDYLGILDIEDKCVITSGGYERFFEKDGVRYHHIIDPRTGYPADSGIISATIISKDGTLADGLSTSLFIMGKDQAEKYWRKNADRFDYILEDEAGKLYVTEGAAAILTTEAEMEVVKK